MQAIHKPSHRIWIDDSIINVKQFKDQFKDALSLEVRDSNATHKYFLKNRISDKEYREIENMCSMDSMKCKDQELVEISKDIILTIDPKLETVRHQAEDLKRRKEDRRYSNMLYHNQKYCNYPPCEMIGPSISVGKIPWEPVFSPEIILSVQIFVPERKSDQKLSTGNAYMPTFQVDQEFLVLGSQFLTELRDKIECVSDLAVPGDFSDCPAVEPTITCKDIYKSGYFYINETFYNDMRDKDCRDYSEIIIKWAGNGKRGIGPFKKALMEKTRFTDLSIQLGYPYLYMHQGECEHLMVFNDLRMHSNHDVCNRNAYPLYVSLKTHKRIFCMVCHAFTATWVVYDNDRLPENPFFFCKPCFLSFNYDVNNQKIGNFRAYHFPDHTKLT